MELGRSLTFFVFIITLYVANGMFFVVVFLTDVEVFSYRSFHSILNPVSLYFCNEFHFKNRFEITDNETQQ